MATSPTRRQPTAMCPLRLDQPCNLCHPDAYLGPQDCPTVAMVMDDPLLREQLLDAKRSVSERPSA